ncbi:MAG: ribosome silencing factor [Desulfovibrio aminophilus]|jgi:ribosome-associated protein|uniref:ribosome silencing factor n=1 Tax=Desulfovibrio aminophilus TaxID=81425 RepID=UPI0039E8364F
MTSESKKQKFNVIPGPEKAALLAFWLSEKQALDVRALDVRGLSSVSDAVLVATAKNLRHGKALADHVLDRCGEHRFEYLGMEGYQAGEWVLLDLNDVVVHIFQDDQRRFYNIEGMWSEAPEIAFEGADGDADE